MSRGYPARWWVLTQLCMHYTQIHMHMLCLHLPTRAHTGQHIHMGYSTIARAGFRGIMLSHLEATCLSHILITCTLNKINQCWWKNHHTLWGGHNDHYPWKVNSYTWAYSPSTSVIPRYNLLTKHGYVLKFELCTEPMTQMSPAATAAIWNIMSF